MTREPRPLHVNLGGVLDPSEVIGRDAEATRVLTSLGSHGALLTGDRRMGKTSLTRLVEARALDVGATVIRASAEGVSLGEFLERLVLVIDEVPILARALEAEAPGGGAALLHLLRRARQDNDGLSMVLSGSIGFHHVVRDQTVVNDVDKVPVGPITDGDAAYLASCLLLGEQVETDDPPRLATAVARAAESVPYYVHHLVADVRDVAIRRGEPVTADDVSPLVEAALVDPDDPWDLRHYRDRLPGYYATEAPLAAAILDAFGAADEPLTIDRLLRLLGTTGGDLVLPDRDGLVSLVERLERDHYLVREGDADRFASELLRRAWLRFRR